MDLPRSFAQQSTSATTPRAAQENPYCIGRRPHGRRLRRRCRRPISQRRHRAEPHHRRVVQHLQRGHLVRAGDHQGVEVAADQGVGPKAPLERQGAMPRGRQLGQGLGVEVGRPLCTGRRAGVRELGERRIRPLRHAVQKAEEGRANAGELDTKHIYAIEHARTNPTFATLIALAEALGPTIAELFAGVT